MKLRPEHFDWLGLICFPFVFVYGYYVLLTGNLPNEWMTKVLIIIGIGGLIIDGVIVYKFFIRKKR